MKEEKEIVCSKDKTNLDRKGNFDKKEKKEEDVLILELKKECDELNDRLMRLMAETENFKKRSEREKKDFFKRSNENLIKDFLPVLDDLKRAMNHAKGENFSAENMIEGLELIDKGLWKVLLESGVEKIDALGESFNPELHEAMLQKERFDIKDNVIIDVFQEGYLLYGRLLRPALVVVSKNTSEKKENSS